MLITQETDYAIRIVDYLVQNKDLTNASEISEATIVPPRFAKNILQKLAGKGIIRSYKGVHGGYKLGKQPKEISLYDVLKATQGPIVLSRCLYDDSRCVCDLNVGCQYYEIFKQLSNEIENKLCGIKFSTDLSIPMSNIEF